MAGLLVCALSAQVLAAENLSGEAKAKIHAAYLQMPLAFEANAGQTDASVKFLARGPGYTVFLTGGDALLLLSREALDQAQPGGVKSESSALRLRFEGARASAPLKAGTPMASRCNYLKGGSPDEWRTNIQQYQQVRQSGVYEGIDVVYYGTRSNLEYDFVVAPGADFNQIVINFEGAENLSMAENGDLLLKLHTGVLRQHKPVVYQEKDGQRQKVEGAYKLLGGTRAGFSVGAHDAARELVIDPSLAYSTMLGDKPDDITHSGDDHVRAIVVDADGYAYVTGYTNAVNFPIAGGALTLLNMFGEPFAGISPHGPHAPLSYDAFITKFKPDGSATVFSTFIGGGNSGTRATPATGDGNDFGYAIAIDGARNVYITGLTYSTNFPVLNAVQAANAGGGDAFLTKVNSSGSAIVFSTYLGGAAADSGNGVAVDASGSAYVVGVTASNKFQRASALQVLFGGGATDAFVTKFNPSGTVLIYSTFLGGSGDDGAQAVATDSSGNAYVAGYTSSTDFPTNNAYQLAPGGGRDAFVCKLNSTGTLLINSTYLGGTGNDQANGVVVDAEGNIYVAGYTTSANFPIATTINLPIPNPSGLANVQSVNGGGTDAFLTKFDRLGVSLVYSTYIGGSGNDIATGVAVDGYGAAYVAGTTTSDDFPTAPLSTLQTGRAGGTDGFVTKYNPTGAPLVYSTYLGSAVEDGCWGVGADAAGNAYAAGYCMSGFTATVGAFQQLPGKDFPAQDISNPYPYELGWPLVVDNADGYVSKINDTSPLITSSKLAVGSPGVTFQYTITATNTGSDTTYNASGLPPNVTVNLSNGLVSGVPPAGSVGVYDATVFATNPAGTGAKRVRIIISGGIPVISGSSTASGTVNRVFTYQITASNGATSYNAQNLPPGITLDSLTGLISGVPLTPATATLVLTAANNAGQSAPFSVALTINSQPPVITSPSTATGYYSEEFNYAIAATNNPQAYQTQPNPPYPGLTIDNSTGLISGTPTAIGPASIVLSATNSGGTATKTFTLTINARPAPVIVSPLTASAVRGQAFSYTISATNNPLTYSVSPSLAGLTFDDATGIWSGIITAPAGANQPITIGASNSGGSATATLLLTITEPLPPVIDSVFTPTVMRGVPFQYTLTATNLPTYFQEVGGPNLPAGLTFIGSGQTSASNPSTWNVINGTTVVAAGDYPATYHAHNINDPVAGPDQIITFRVVNPPAPIITSPGSAAATLGVAFSYTITNLNFADTYSISAGVLPAGLTLTGKTISGTVSDPLQVGAHTVTLRAANSADATAVGTKSLTITVNPRVVPSITNNPLTANGLDGSFFAYQITASGTTPMTYSASGFAAGSALSVDAATGIISGTLNSNDVGTRNITLTATNDVASATATLVLTVSATPPVISSTLTLPDATAGTGYLFQLQAAGTTPIVFSSLDPMPSGLSVVNTPVPAITGTPASGAVGTSTFRLKAENSVSSDTKIFALTVLPQPPGIVLNPASVTGMQGSPFSYTVQLSGTPPVTLDAAGLPPGLALSGTVISGTPGANSVGAYSVTLTASNASAQQAVAHLQISISSAAPEFSSNLAATGTVNSPFTYKITATGAAPVTFSASNLPSWLAFNGADTLSGTPPSAGQFTVTLGAANAYGSTAATLTIDTAFAVPAITNATAVTTEVGQPFSLKLTATGSQPIVFAATGLPSTLTLAGDTISGTPAVEASYAVTVTATNAAGVATATITITVGPAAARITSPLSVVASVGLPFSYTITASGSSPITYSASSLPDGFAFSGGTITGKPASAGTLTAVISAQNPYGPADTRLLTITTGERDGDADGDGFTDELEVILKTDPNAAASTPFGGQPAGTNEVLNITGMTIKLLFNSSNRDSIAIRGTLPLDSALPLAGQSAILVIGELPLYFTLDDKGAGTVGGSKLQIRQTVNDTAAFTVKMGKESYRDYLASSGLTGNANYIGVSRKVSVYLLLNHKVYRSFKLLSWTAKSGKTGNARQASAAN